MTVADDLRLLRDHRRAGIEARVSLWLAVTALVGLVVTL